MARKDNTAEMHHVVPKHALLNNFAFGSKRNKAKKVHLYDKSIGSIVPGATSVNNVLAQRNFYSVRKGESILSIEQELAVIEDAAAPIIAQLTKTFSLSSLDNTQRATLAHFVAVQYLRSPKIRDAHTLVSRAVLDKANKLYPGASDTAEIRAFSEKNAVKLRSLGTMNNAMVKIAEMLFSYRWTLHSAPDNQFFWISDHPVALYNTEDLGAYSNLTFEAYGIQISMPLSPSIILCIWHPSLVQEFNSRYKKKLNELAELKGKKVFGNYRSQLMHDATISQLDLSLNNIKKIIDNLDHGDALPGTVENLEHFNSLQFDWAHRFLVSRKKNFELADRMFADNPDGRIKFTTD
ncbi:MAG: DUF4238 domain-containing protein [Rhizobiaceae bacterium]|nr:DUF4238 domain-containing protein [Rhizobiaceae bacterium]